MSIINKMLQDLDNRQGMSGGDAAKVIPQVRSVPANRADRDWFWRVIAALMIVSLGWVVWIAWQLQPRESVATAEAMKAAENAKRGPLPVQVAVVPAPAPVAVPPPSPVVEPDRPAPRVVEQPRPAAPAAARELPTRKSPASTNPAPVAGGATRLDLDVAPARILAAPVPMATRVQKQDRARSADERAESEFRRGATLLNQGRVSEAEDAFVAALGISQTHEPARQALISLNLEQRRMDDAQRLLKEGLIANPANVQFALVLARIHAGRREYAMALEVLSGARASARSNPDFDALLGNVLQRLGRHAEAVDVFRTVLRVVPGNGPVWAGLGISLEAIGSRPEALEAFQRVLTLVPGGSDLSLFAEQRLRALR